MVMNFCGQELSTQFNNSHNWLFRKDWLMYVVEQYSTELSHTKSLLKSIFDII